MCIANRVTPRESILLWNSHSMPYCAHRVSNSYILQLASPTCLNGMLVGITTNWFSSPRPKPMIDCGLEGWPHHSPQPQGFTKGKCAFKRPSLWLFIVVNHNHNHNHLRRVNNPCVMLWSFKCAEKSFKACRCVLLTFVNWSDIYIWFACGLVRIKE